MHTTQTQANNPAQKSANKPTHPISSGAQMLVVPSRIFPKLLWTNFLLHLVSFCVSKPVANRTKERRRKRGHTSSSYRHRMCCRKFNGSLILTLCQLLFTSCIKVTLPFCIADHLINCMHDMCGWKALFINTRNKQMNKMAYPPTKWLSVFHWVFTVSISKERHCPPPPLRLHAAPHSYMAWAIDL